MEDFNLPHINWNNLTLETEAIELKTLFIKKMRDGFLSHHIYDMIKIRGDDISIILNLLSSNEKSIVEKIKVDRFRGKKTIMPAFLLVLISRS